MRSAGEKRLVAMLGPMDTIIANKFIRTLAVAEEPLKGNATQAQGHKQKGDSQPTSIFKTGTKLMYGGQGKNTNNISLTSVTATMDNGDNAMDESISRTLHGGLAQPRLDDTNEEVTGEGKCKLQKQNEQRKQRLKATQRRHSQWTEHTGRVAYDSTPLSRSRGEYRNFMCPTGRALNHPAADILRNWATCGCPTRTGRNWTKDEMWEAVERGPHRSATTPEAIKHFAEEIKEKLRMNQACLVPWDDIKDNPPPQLKISPIVAIPHKSKAFRSILDLSCAEGQQRYQSIASIMGTTTNKQ